MKHPLKEEAVFMQKVPLNVQKHISHLESSQTLLVLVHWLVLILKTKQKRGLFTQFFLNSAFGKDILKLLKCLLKLTIKKLFQNNVIIVYE